MVVHAMKDALEMSTKRVSSRINVPYKDDIPVVVIHMTYEVVLALCFLYW